MLRGNDTLPRQKTGSCVEPLIFASAGTTKGSAMFRCLARSLLVSFILSWPLVALAIPPAQAHDSWISRGKHRNAAGEWCCGDGDCFVVPGDKVSITAEGYRLFGVETVPFNEAQPSPDGTYWRCKRGDGSRRCF